MFRNFRRLFFFLSLILISFGTGSCSKKTYPSGLEGNLIGNQAGFKRDERKRERIVRRETRRTRKLERKAKRPQVKRKAEGKKLAKKLAKLHRDKQHPDVQARMKQSERETRELHKSRKPFKERLMFWKRTKKRK